MNDANGKCIDVLRGGRLDIVGDVHGELEALERLLDKLGYDEDGTHAEDRHLVFLGDLIDRGPDSPGVLRRVMALVAAGRAQCIVGNHEMNALRNDPEKRRSGEGWWYRRRESRYDAVLVDEEEREEVFRPWLRSRPAALEHEALRIVHACWDASAIARLRGAASVIHTFHAEDARLAPALREQRDRASAEMAERGLTARDLRNVDVPMPFLQEKARYDEMCQVGNAVKVVTSGREQVAPDSFCASGKWRMVERVKWWDEYADTDVVVGHYWRRYEPDTVAPPEKSAADLFGALPPNARLGPAGRVMCIDYSVGFRFDERRKGRDPARFQGCLAALRWPEWELVFDDDRPGLAVPR